MNIQVPLVVVDVEADGPVPGLYSMVSLGAVVVEPGLNRKCRFEFAPISDNWMPDALAISGISREQHLKFTPARRSMLNFGEWARSISAGRLQLISDNPAFDFMFTSYYFWKFLGWTPFGHSGRRIGDLFAGTTGNANAQQGWKKLRKTPHTHDPLDDAMGMAEALLAMKAGGLRFANIPD